VAASGEGPLAGVVITVLIFWIIGYLKNRGLFRWFHEEAFLSQGIRISK
jgi:hypothetical protein